MLGAPRAAHASLTSVIIDLPHALEHPEQHAPAQLVSRIELQQLHDRGLPFTEVAESQLQIGVAFERKQVEARQRGIVTVEAGIRALP